MQGLQRIQTSLYKSTLRHASLSNLFSSIISISLLVCNLLTNDIVMFRGVGLSFYVRPVSWLPRATARPLCEMLD